MLSLPSCKRLDFLVQSSFVFHTKIKFEDFYGSFLALAYGLVESGRLWYLTSNSALCQKFGLRKSKFQPTLYYRKRHADTLQLLVLVQVDNYIYTGAEEQTKMFQTFLREQFDIGSVERDLFHVYGSEIEKIEDGSIMHTQQQKLNEISDLSIVSGETIFWSGTKVATPDEMKKYRSMLGELLFLGHLTQLFMLHIAS